MMKNYHPKQKAILLIYGSGGHKEQMVRLYKKIYAPIEASGIKLIGICENNAAISALLENHEVTPLRNKNKKIMTLIQAPISIVGSFIIILKLFNKYNICGVISTGPGIVIIPALFSKLKKAKVIYIESWSRITTISYTGKFMRFLSDVFYVQHEQLHKENPYSRYSGLL